MSSSGNSCMLVESDCGFWMRIIQEMFPVGRRTNTSAQHWHQQLQMCDPNTDLSEPCGFKPAEKYKAVIQVDMKLTGMCFSVPTNNHFLNHFFLKYQTEVCKELQSRRSKSSNFLCIQNGNIRFSLPWMILEKLKEYCILFLGSIHMCFSNMRFL